MLGPKLEQIENHDYPSRRIESYRDRVRTVHAELVDPGEAMEVARHVWRECQPIDEVRVVNERTGFTSDTISRI